MDEKKVLVMLRRKIAQSSWDSERDGDIFDAARPLIEAWERDMEETAALFEARKSTKH